MTYFKDLRTRGLREGVGGNFSFSCSHAEKGKNRENQKRGRLESNSDVKDLPSQYRKEKKRGLVSLILGVRGGEKKCRLAGGSGKGSSFFLCLEGVGVSFDHEGGYRRGFRCGRSRERI